MRVQKNEKMMQVEAEEAAPGLTDVVGRLDSQDKRRRSGALRQQVVSASTAVPFGNMIAQLRKTRPSHSPATPASTGGEAPTGKKLNRQLLFTPDVRGKSATQASPAVILSEALLVSPTTLRKRRTLPTPYTNLKGTYERDDDTLWD